jgi:NADPH-dependent ferric siderophore reductase
MTDAPPVTRVRHEVTRRPLVVACVERLAPRMVRVVLRGAALAGFTSLGFDDHVKLFLPASGAGAPEMRDFTPHR